MRAYLNLFIIAAFTFVLSTLTLTMSVLARAADKFDVGKGHIRRETKNGVVFHQHEHDLAVP